jgi:hypothetical protein
MVLPLIVNPTVPRQFEAVVAASGAPPTARSGEKPPEVDALAEPRPSIRREEAAARTPADR